MGDVEGSENILCDSLNVDTCHCIFVQSHRMHSSSEFLFELWTLSNYNVPKCFKIWKRQELKI